MDRFLEYSVVMQAFLASLFMWGCTAFGAALVFFVKSFNQKLLDSMLGFAAGVMIAASFWSLLAPSISLSELMGYTPWKWPLIGFLTGGAFLRLVDYALPHFTHGSDLPSIAGEEGPEGKKKSFLMILAITLHNIPEGFAVGVAFGAVSIYPEATIPAAIALAIGIGIQNIPEGFAVAMPLRRERMSRSKSFFYGQLSGVVEPLAAVFGAYLVNQVRPMLPFALAFAAGAMIFVVIEDMIPESQGSGNAKIATFGTMMGFAVMMILDVALG